MLDLFREVVNGHIKEYEIKDTLKLEEVAESIGIPVEGRSVKEIANDLYDELERTYTQVEGEIPFAKRVPERTLETWRKEGIVPRGAMREIMELMHRTHMGVDQHYENLTKQFSRTALADGWGGSMVATEISDILFGTPSPVLADVNMGVLKEDHVNIIVHGHEPNLFESILVSVAEPSLVEARQECRSQGNQPGGHVLLRGRDARPARRTSCRELHEHGGGDRNRGRGCHGRGRAVHQAGVVQGGRMLRNPSVYHQPPVPHRGSPAYRVP